MTLRPTGYRPRLIESKIQNAMNAAGAVSVEGPKSCGKTWCCRNFANSEFSLVDPTDDFINRRIAVNDPSASLDGDQPHLIDEWQDVPRIWDAVRYTVDQTGEKGRFLLCGSSSIDKTSTSHSGVARIISVRMHPMSLLESGESSGKISLKGMFEGSFKTIKGEQPTLDELAGLIIRGGWPGLIGTDDVSSTLLLRDYLDKLCEVDVQKIDGKQRNVMNLKRLIRSLARNETTMAAKKKLSSDIAEYDHERIDEETVSTYLDLFDKLFMICDQPAYSPGYRSSVRIAKTPKRHFVDPSLAAAALGLDRKSLIGDLNTFGFLFEALCERDLRIYADHIGGNLYHYRDHSGREVDAVVEIPGMGWGAFEIKTGHNAVDDAAKNLLKISEFIRNDGKAEPPAFLCVLHGIGGLAYRREDGVYVVPITMLGP